MDSEKPHCHCSSSSSSISDLFICFTSEKPHSSLKSGQQQASPMFSNGGNKKKGPGFENPEPSSPKVTCIGQVRVNKSKKKQGKKLRACRSNNGECKKWVHLPLTVCQALRAFCGSRSSSCMDNSKEDKTGGRSGSCNERRHVFEDVVEEDDQACPPKDALLLMRCRSDPVKMADFADQICWETQERGNEDEEQKEETLTQVSSDPEAMEPDPGNQKNLLPDCLLLMMCEPKLSMEVSKETWVCSRDFIKPPLVKQKDGGDEPPVSLHPPPPAAASSCPLPVDTPLVTEESTTGDASGGGGGSTATVVVDQKLVGGKGYEPFVLTRCMSEPIRSSAKLAPNAC
ncbi:hypothetical protein HRI_001086000 [Hibiscus trionum]|uniref:Uncharacterized protein n=1 Tax=Hibiscus trionum TaxID=183268 RepID=A0A9W7HAZ5_HIBTR|nr:hypothetical protein HRI_001086000 [Hibiscus trionum]